MTQQEGNHIPFIRGLFQERFGLQISNASIRTPTPSNRLQAKQIELVRDNRFTFTYRIGTEASIPSSCKQEVPGHAIASIPDSAQVFILRIPNVEAYGHHPRRLQNEVAANALLKDALVDFPGRIIPTIHGWSSTENEHGWVIEEHMPGVSLSKLFPKCSVAQKRSILGQLASILQLLQQFSLPASVRDFGGFCYDEKGTIVSGLLPFLAKGPFPSLAAFYKATAVEGLELSEKSRVLDGWRSNDLRKRVDAFVERGVDEVCGKLNLQQKSFIHGDFNEGRGADLQCDEALGHFLIDSESLNITAFVDHEMCQVGHPIHEFFHSFYDLYSFLPGPYVISEQNLAMHKALLNGVPDPPPNSTNRDLTSASHYGSGANIDWDLLKMWNGELDKAGAQRPASMGPEVGEISAIYWFAEDVCPPYLLLQPAEKAEQLQKMYKENGGKMLTKYLERWGY